MAGCGRCPRMPLTWGCLHQPGTQSSTCGRVLAHHCRGQWCGRAAPAVAAQQCIAWGAGPLARPCPGSSRHSCSARMLGGPQPHLSTQPTHTLWGKRRQLLNMAAWQHASMPELFSMPAPLTQHEDDRVASEEHLAAEGNGRGRTAWTAGRRGGGWRGRRRALSCLCTATCTAGSATAISSEGGRWQQQRWQGNVLLFWQFTWRA